MKNAMDKRTERIPVLLSPRELAAINSVLAYYNSILSKKISLGELVRRTLIHEFFAHQEECLQFAEVHRYAQ